jgi:hypothetical protein
MNSRTFLIMIAAILVMIALFYTTPSDIDGVDHDLFLPNLKAGINDVDKITITTANNEFVATLQRGDTQWTVIERSGFPANVGKIRSNLIALAEAKIVEAKTTDPALYDRLGVQDLDQTDASGTRIDISGPGQSISLIVVNKDLLNVSPTDVHAVSIKHPDGDFLRIEKPGREATGFTVLEIPDDRELSYSSIADPIGGLLTALTLDDVEAATALDLSEVDPVVARFETFDGLVIETDAYQLDDGIKVRFRFTADQSLANSFTEADDSSPEADSEAEVTAFSSTVTKAEELNAELGPWIFTLPSFKSDQLVKKMEDLLK